ncbi:MAG: BREX-1 system adenine-specific DNA-methyltransferase PglX [Lactobacillus gallinarum]
MDKNKIKKFAINARQHLRDTVEVKLAGLGITADKINNELPISTTDKKYYVDDNENNALTGAQIGWRRDIVNELKNRDYDNDPKTAFNDFVEEVAYTWFNRIIALRFMEVNNYLPSRVRVLTSEEGKAEPDIVDEAMEIEDDLGGYSDQEKELITNALTDKTPELMDQLYMMLFIKQCDALSEILPGLFEKTRNYLKLLFTPHYDRGVIQDLINEIPESYFDVNEEGQVQIIGWLYQYYNTVPKENSFKKKRYQTDDIPPVTQLFTPDWIVRYMVENSLGRYWIDILHSKGDSRSEKEIAEDFGWKYYMPSSEKNEIQTSDELAKKDVTNIKFVDPAMGSGHILVYAFEVFMQIYETQGYSDRDAASLIIKNNLYGLDIDTRAYQLSYFALLMKARQNDRRLFRRDHQVHLYDVPTIHYVVEDYHDLITDLGLNKEKTTKDLKKVLDVFKYGDDLGSIIKVDKDIDIDNLRKLTEMKEEPEQLSFLADSIMKREQLSEVLNVAEVLRNKYDIAVTNPPYMGGGKMDAPLKKYVQKNYPDAKADLFSVFMEKLMNLTTEIGYIGMVTMHSWMFLSNFEKLRMKIQSHTIVNMAHLGTRAFEDIGGEVVQTTTFILQNQFRKNYVGSYERLVDYDSQDKKEKVFLAIVKSINKKDLYQGNQLRFQKIPGIPIVYWLSSNFINIFQNKSLSNFGTACVGLQTSNNKRFVRKWTEVNFYKIGINIANIEESEKSLKKWFPYNKGGNFRKWYGNREYVVNWERNGYEIREYNNHLNQTRKSNIGIANTKFYFKESGTWGLVSTNKFSVRYSPQGSIFDTGGSSLFSKNIKYLIGLLNTNLVQKIMYIQNPTLNYQPGNVSKIPIVWGDQKNIVEKVTSNIKISKQDWDAFETSWDFKKNPLLLTNASVLQQAYKIWSQEALNRFNQLKDNEEELNKIFITLYGLQDELTPEEDDKEVSVRKADQVRDIKAFLSYFIGCVFGRYSLDKDGLAYAGGDWNNFNYQTFIPNKDNIILLTDRQYFEDSRDIIVRLKEFLSKTFDPDHLSDNMNFIAQTLDSKKFEKGTNAEQIIRDYFLNDFYKDHSKIYQKRPIYWEFSSGRNKGFKALMYLHRYTPDQLAMVRHYLHDLQPAMNDLINVDQNLLDQETTASAKSKYRKTISTLNKQMAEMVKYDQILDHLSQNPVDLDLDDGVLVNHDKLQQGEKLLSKL